MKNLNQEDDEFAAKSRSKIRKAIAIMNQMALCWDILIKHHQDLIELIFCLYRVPIKSLMNWTDHLMEKVAIT